VPSVSLLPYSLNPTPPPPPCRTPRRLTTSSSQCSPAQTQPNSPPRRCPAPLSHRSINSLSQASGSAYVRRQFGLRRYWHPSMKPRQRCMLPATARLLRQVLPLRICCSTPDEAFYISWCGSRRRARLPLSSLHPMPRHRSARTTPSPMATPHCSAISLPRTSAFQWWCLLPPSDRLCTHVGGGGGSCHAHH
jgi:hypothetical protein